MGRIRNHKFVGQREQLQKNWNRQALIKRDGAICQLCLEPIDSMKDATIDHITPVSKGGTDQLNNLRLTHHLCNQERGNGFF